MTTDLAPRFLMLWSGDAPAGELPGLELTLQQILTTARAAWPEVELATDDFLAFLARHCSPTDREDNPSRRLVAMHTSDMYFVAACLRGSPRAIELFERDFLLAHSPTLVRLRLAPDLLEETRQVLRHRFFVGGGTGDSPPKLAEYSGAGTLRGWVRVATVRTAFTLGRVPVGLVATDAETLAKIASPASHLELDYLKRHYGVVAREALGRALAALSVRERNLLRQSFALEMSIDALSLVYGVHRATVARWIGAAREALVEHTRDQIKSQLAISEGEVSSILELIRSQLADAIGELLVET
jgi:RNA polymerase sigma-70 factor (ECF subfamily)